MRKNKLKYAQKNKKLHFTYAKSMKKIFSLFIGFCLVFAVFCVIPRREVAFAEDNEKLLAIIIDDFGGYERGGVDEMLNLPIPLTCAVIPFVENTRSDAELAAKSGKEVILHMPMESHVNLPLSWYGPVFIGNYDSESVACGKIDKCLAEIPEAVGANIHIGSGVSQNKKLMTAIINHFNSKGMFFCDSKTITNSACEGAAIECNTPYISHDVFLEPHGEKSYASACKYLLKAGEIALDKGYAIAIGHVGREGGADTARAILDSLPALKMMGIKIVPLSEIAALLRKNVV